MNPLLVGAVLVGLVAVSTAIGLIVRNREGRVLEVRKFRQVIPADLGSTEKLGSTATLLQFSTQMCSKCPATHELLHKTADARAGVRHIEIDVTHRPDIANDFNIMQTPTTLILDASGAIAARIGGAPRLDALKHAIDIAQRRDHGLYVI
jgi:thiol-disulfide isomerase/thioredoxin